jgi:hypothetical protein
VYQPVSGSARSLPGHPANNGRAGQGIVKRQCDISCHAEVRADKREQECDTVEHRYETPVPGQSVQAVLVGVGIGQSCAQGVLPQQVEEDSRCSECGAIDERGKLDVRTPREAIFGEDGSVERQQRGAQQQQQFVDQQDVIAAMVVVEHCMVIGSDHADLKEAQDIGEI